MVKLSENYGLTAPLQSNYPLPIISTRTPTTGDTNFIRGQLWVTTTSGQIYGLAEVSNGLATWSLLGPGASDVDTLTGDGGGAISPAGGNITLGGGTNVTTAGAGSTITFNLDDAITLSGLLTANASAIINTAGTALDLGADVDSAAINIGTPAAARTITIGNVTGTTQVAINSGTGGVALVGTGGGSITLSNDDTILLDSGAALELNASGGTISIGNDAVSQGVNIGTAGVRTVAIGNPTGATGVMIATGSSGLLVDTFGGGNIGMDSTGTILLDSDGALQLNSSAGNISIGNDAVSLVVSLGTGSAAMTNIIGSTNTTSSTLIQGGTGGISLSAAGDVGMVPATNSVAGISLTLNARVGRATFTGQTTAVGANVDLTITNSEISPGGAVFCTVSNLGSNDADITLEGCITETDGVLLLRCQNNGTGILNGDIVATFWIIN